MKKKILSIIMLLFTILLLMIFVGLIVFSIYCWIVYGDLPPEEVPSWVHWVMLG